MKLLKRPWGALETPVRPRVASPCAILETC